MSDNNSRNLDIDGDCVVLVLKCSDENGVKAELYNFSDGPIHENEDQIFLHVLARGMMNIALQDMEAVLEVGQESMLEQYQEHEEANPEPVVDRFDDPNVIDLSTIRPKGRA